jgi:predicted AlkP superfamily phosphohydrolase/phosphomutase
MMSSKDPGELGIYGFRNRADHSYDKMFIATGNYIREKRVWDYAGDAERTSVVVGVPQTFPPKEIRGSLITGFLAPGRESNFTYPPALKQELLAIAPEYDVDVANFRTDNKDDLLAQIWKMTRDRFKVIDHLLVNKPWDFFMLMEIGVDRMHHAFWDYQDPQHRNYVPGNPYENAIRDYYIYIDEKIGEWLSKLDDDTAVLVVSDHGAKRMDGGIALNQWLWQEGYLAFESDPPDGTLTRFSDLTVDWPRTQVWGDGGYYGRVFINVEGREPQGVVPAGEYEAFREELAERIRNIPGPDGEPLGTRVFKPEELYRKVNGVAPDLIVYFGDLYWRSVGTLGYDGIYTFENDTGPDACNHAQHGLFILYDPRSQSAPRRVEGAEIYDVAPTILNLMGITPENANFRGHSLV